MSDAIQRAQKILAVASAALSALGTVGEVATGTLGRSSALEDATNALRIISEIVNAVRTGIEGTATATDIEDALRVLREKIASNDAGADAALDAKFPA